MLYCGDNSDDDDHEALLDNDKNMMIVILVDDDDGIKMMISLWAAVPQSWRVTVSSPHTDQVRSVEWQQERCQFASWVLLMFHEQGIKTWT